MTQAQALSTVPRQVIPDILAEFKHAMRNSRIEPPVHIIADNRIHRFNVAGDLTQNKNGWYILHADQPAAGAFGCWKRGISEVWSSQTYRPLGPAEKAAYTAKMAEIKRQSEEERQQIQVSCRTWCAGVWAKAKDATNENPYLRSKEVNSYGLKVFKDTLLVPVQDMSGEIHGLQFITPEGNKRFKRGTNKAGHFFKIGVVKDNTVIISEGYATGASIHQATGHAVVIAFDSGNLLPVAQNIHAKHPAIQIIIAADNDQWTEGNPGICKAVEAAHAVGGLLVNPVFADTSMKPTDYNDLQRLQGLDQVRLQIEAATTAKDSKRQNETEAPSIRIVYRKMADITPEPIKWLWPDRFARGKVSMLAGDPGLGKSQILSSMAAVVSTGGLWPVDRIECKPGNVIILSSEDDAADTIRPRLDAAGADVQRVFILDAVINKTGEQRSFNLAADIDHLRQMIEKIGGAALISIDPISAYLGGINSHSNADVRALLSPLSELAAKYDSAIIGVSHLNKREGGEALYRISGSLAFVAAARAAYLIVKDADDLNRRLFLPLKNNIGNDNTGLAFTIESKLLSSGIETSRVSWEPEPVNVTVDDVMRSRSESEPQTALDDAKKFLFDTLSSGPRASNEVRALAQGEGLSWRTVQRAQKEMGIDPSKTGMTGPWIWQLPTKNAKEHEDSQANNMAIFRNVGSLRQTSGQIPSFAEEDFPHQGSYES